MNQERIEKNSKRTYDKERLTRMFDNQAEYRARHKPDKEKIPETAARKSIELLEPNPDDIVLDHGCGVGTRCIQIADRCNKIIGIDISRKSLEIARKRAADASIENVTFAYGELENPSAEIDLTSYGINKILTVYSMHHLPDEMKVESLSRLSLLLKKPGRIVIGDLMFFDDPCKHRDDFHKIYYDDGDTDFPCEPELIVKKLQQLGAKVKVEQIHPLVGVITADFD